MKKTFALAIASIIASGCAPLQSKVGRTGNANAEIESIVETFRMSIVRKDKPGFMKLFYAENIPWLGVKDDESLALVARSGKATSKIGSDTYTAFIDFVVAEQRPVAETFSNLHIATDGDVATLDFDYSFNIGSKRTNSGKEIWQLVRTIDGWRINSIVYSVKIDQTVGSPTG